MTTMDHTSPAVIDPPTCTIEPLAPVDVAATAAARRTGLLGRDSYRKVMVLQPARQVHTFGMRFAIDVAWCDRSGRVLRTARVAPNRMSAWVCGAHSVLEAEAGAFDRLGIGVGDHVACLPVGGDQGTYLVRC
ncbi:MAG: DUF192 domain-containing protein [Actinobacteria bacterium]|nr:DUF192 domain-containing protein [Actinomycetota bacterium]